MGHGQQTLKGLGRIAPELLGEHKEQQRHLEERGVTSWQRVEIEMSYQKNAEHLSQCLLIPKKKKKIG